jgi:predicted O-methyltransferase YrrM
VGAVVRDFSLGGVRALIGEAMRDEPTGDPFLDARYDEATAQRGEPLYYYRFFYLFARKFKPRFSVELGAWRATCAAHMAGGNPDGVVVTIDHHTDPGDEAHRAKALEAAQHYSNLFYLQGWTWDMVGEVRAFGKRVEVLFIDAWHQYDHIARDWRDYSPLLADTALVVVDDLMETDGPVIAGMRRFWDELPGEKFIDEGLHFVEGGSAPMGFLRHVG